VERSLLILGSSSPRRLALLEQIGITPDRVLPAEIDESQQADELPRAHALRIALQKVQAVKSRLALEDHAVILAADTVVACGRRILPKAEDDGTVTKCLTLLSGRRHTVYTAIAIMDVNGKIHSRISETKLAFRRLDSKEIADYVTSREGLGKAGGYAIQGRAAIFVRFMGGSYSNVVGLPLLETFQLLRSCGVA